MAASIVHGDRLDQADTAQHAQVLRQRCLADLEIRDELRGADLPSFALEQEEDPET